MFENTQSFGGFPAGMGSPKPVEPVPFSLRVSGAWQPSTPYIYHLVKLMCLAIDVPGECRLRIRGEVTSRPDYDLTVDLKDGPGTRLAVQVYGVCHECFLNNKNVHARDLKDMIRSTNKFSGGCFRAKPEDMPPVYDIAETCTSLRESLDVVDDLYRALINSEERIAQYRAEQERLRVKIEAEIRNQAFLEGMADEVNQIVRDSQLVRAMEFKTSRSM